MRQPPIVFKEEAVCFAGRTAGGETDFEKVNVKWVFFDGYTLIDEGRVRERRFAEQAQTARARELGLTVGYCNIDFGRDCNIAVLFFWCRFPDLFLELWHPD